MTFTDDPAAEADDAEQDRIGTDSDGSEAAIETTPNLVSLFLLLSLFLCLFVSLSPLASDNRFEQSNTTGNVSGGEYFLP